MVSELQFPTLSLDGLSKLIESLAWNWEKVPIFVVKFLENLEEIGQSGEIFVI
jgi:hypothetical protein